VTVQVTKRDGCSVLDADVLAELDGASVAPPHGDRELRAFFRAWRLTCSCRDVDVREVVDGYECGICGEPLVARKVGS
jgi:hypothetical protein